MKWQKAENGLAKSMKKTFLIDINYNDSLNYSYSFFFEA
jgi:hypothetical protein